MNINGCYKCEDRCLGCHSNCLKYAEYKQYLQNIKDRKEQEKKNFPTARRNKVYARKNTIRRYG